SGYILSIAQGTPSSRAIIFDGDMKMASSAQAEITQYYPQPGWVEHDAAEILRSVVDTVRKAIADAGSDAADIAASGITNQRETAVVWD
ncbi:FGGY family carbohydrate kinase, partial [Rhizobium leguminosarum]|uniref:FGGY family carbohydrate kinase n=1 Tax=Rhizobium leguminosarum TaxID=384 RepID=UPI003F9A7914